jgi:MurNAc alpha-1-phosphate uridylyltransferase
LGSDTFLLVNGDVWCDLDFNSIPQSLDSNDQALLYLVKQPEWRERGDFSLLDGRVVESESPQYLYAGIALYHPSILDGAKVEKFSIVPRLKQAIAVNRVAGLLHKGEWDDVGTPERLQAIQANHGN